MKLKFTINETATFFHFLDSISAWDIHTRSSVKKYYEERLGLSEEAQSFLKKYCKIRKKYPWKKLDSDFYTSGNFDEAFLKLKKRLNKSEFVQLKVIIEYFRTDLRRIFAEWKKFLIQRKKLLEREIKKHNLDLIFLDIANFYDSKNYPKTIYVHLLVNPSDHSCGGGANILPKENITLEPRSLKSTKRIYLNQDISVIAHEILHLIESHSNKTKWNQFERLMKKEKIAKGILTEAIADTMFPAGYLASKYKLVPRPECAGFSRLKIPKRENAREYYRKARKKLSAKIYLKTKKQIESGKNIFENGYLTTCTLEYKKLLSAE